MTRAAFSASDIAIHYGMTPRYWTRMAAEGKVPGAWQPSGSKGKWLFDKVIFDRWRRTRRKEISEWPGYTSAGKYSGGEPNAPGGSTDSPSAPKIAALLKSVCASG